MTTKKHKMRHNTATRESKITMKRSKMISETKKNDHKRENTHNNTNNNKKHRETENGT